MQVSTFENSNIKVLEALDSFIKLKVYSFKTRKSYIGHVRRLIEYYQKDPISLTEVEIKSYLVYLLDEKRTSHSYINQTVSAIELLHNEYANSCRTRKREKRQIHNTFKCSV